jgi:HD-GYP domain-containing protein (c-di-GMP phosphodiesterase class II)
MAAELGRARKTVNLARRLMSQLLKQVRSGDTIDAEKLGPLVDEIADSLSRNNSTLTSVLRLKRKDEYTYMHSVTVSALMINLARELDFSEEKVREAGMAGLLHDIGKMAIDDRS